MHTLVLGQAKLRQLFQRGTKAVRRTSDGCFLHRWLWLYNNATPYPSQSCRSTGMYRSDITILIKMATPMGDWLTRKLLTLERLSSVQGNQIHVVVFSRHYSNWLTILNKNYQLEFIGFHSSLSLRIGLYKE